MAAATKFLVSSNSASEPYIDSAMPEKSEIIVSAPEERDTKVAVSMTRDLMEIAVVFGLILAAVWTPQGQLNSFFSISAAACVVAFAIVGRWGARELGLTRPLAGTAQILLIGAACCGVMWAAGFGLRFAGAGYRVPLGRSWEYALWALFQQFILQSIFFLRLESLLGSRSAVFWSTVLFATAHIPSPALTGLSFLGGLMFCALFRRWRNIYPLGIIHAALGLTIAANLPDIWLHHMRVGVGYLASR
jgi:hypothetical protein